MQRVCDAGISLTTRILVHHIWFNLLAPANRSDDRVLLPRQHEGPGLRPRLRIFERRVVVDRCRAHGHKVLDDTKTTKRNSWRDARADASPALLVGVIGRLDDQSVALPVASRIPLPAADVWAEMRTPIEW